ncbi:MAG: flagellar hook-length control protein FliK [Deltaproteobacteria bacterium]|nr:flagellar hook-length control protein FliK [Deltaproteobacteria bacterium]
MKTLLPFPDRSASPVACNPAAHGRRPASFSPSDRSRFERILAESGSSAEKGRPVEPPRSERADARAREKSERSREGETDRPKDVKENGGTKEPGRTRNTEKTRELKESKEAEAAEETDSAGETCRAEETDTAGETNEEEMTFETTIAAESADAAPVLLSAAPFVMPMIETISTDSSASATAGGTINPESVPVIAPPLSALKETSPEAIPGGSLAGCTEGEEAAVAAEAAADADKKVASPAASRTKGTPSHPAALESNEFPGDLAVISGVSGDGADPAAAEIPKAGDDATGAGRLEKPAKAFAGETHTVPETSQGSSKASGRDAASAFVSAADAAAESALGIEAREKETEPAAVKIEGSTDTGTSHPVATDRLAAEKTDTAHRAAPAQGQKTVRFGEHDFVIQRKSDTSVEVTLSPPGVGKLEIEVVLEKGVVNARITAADSAGRELIARNLPDIVEALARDGMNIGGFTVSLKDRRDRSGEARQHGASSESEERIRAAASPGAPANASSSGLVNLFV